MHRLFVAIRPPRAVRQRLLAIMGGVRGARWQSDDQLHLTLRFIGEVDRHLGDDIHAATASEVMDTPIQDVTSDQRRLAKIVNFGVLYGMSEYGLAQQSGLPPAEAGQFIKRYFDRLMN